MSAESTGTLKPVYAGEEGRGWIVGWDLPRSTPEAAAWGDEAVGAWVSDLLDMVSLPRGACTWVGWNAFDLELPTPWQPDDEGPLQGRWSEAQFFHERMEIRLQRTPAVLRVRLLTEEEPIRAVAQDLGSRHMPQAADVPPEPFRTFPGQLLLAGRALSLDALPEGSLGEVQYPRILRYRRSDGPAASVDRSGRVRLQVTRYFDQLYRLRAIRYRALGA